jgi:HPt (histidine-containing phosphotransfer) domain-containing protein
LLRGLVDLFADQATSQLAELRETAAGGDASKLQEVAHSLKGASATMGAIGVASASAVIEAAASRGEVAGPGELDKIARALESATVALRARAPTSPS